MVRRNVDVKVQAAVVTREKQTVRMNPCRAAYKQWRPLKGRNKEQLGSNNITATETLNHST
ncbi:hypothetical protein DAPPUDRAFT_340922 [Daphnia pulex]|uniref:Uncharacterized protein n=1 Tax=Daphnia pulex TaxID=6669 RepID=E9I4X8_DAPPU|nr:hypothetical protein DAPPUDRAFT_340922 [Daphnia pulex]|eukprot:EFX60952.1 hypothetical protein DAPPUDRAFT_340922 [Daphnia pulex]